MKKITLVIALIFSAITLNAQSDCSSAVAVSAGNTYTSSTISGTLPSTSCFSQQNNTTDLSAANWYSYTNSGSSDEAITVTTDLPANTGGDTRVSIYSGSCGSLTCVAINDDVYFGGQNDPNNNFLSTVEFLAEVGETYYIVFDNNWSPAGFDFDVTSGAVPAVPGIASNPTPAVGATNVTIDTADNNGDGSPDNSVAFSWDAPTTGDPVDSYIFYLGDSPSTLSALGSTANTSVNITGMTEGTLYYWAIIPQNVGGSPDPSTISVWSFTTDGNMNVNDFDTKELTHYTNNGMLFIDAESQLDNIEIYSILGQRVNTESLNGNNANINISHLQKGVYLAKVSAEGKTKTFKFIKK